MGWRRHVHAFFTSFGYMRRAWRAAQAECLISWYRAGRVGDRWIEFFLRDPFAFWTVRILPGLLPLPAKWKRFLTEWRYARDSIAGAAWFMVHFYRDAAFRVRWLTHEVEEGAKEGMLTPAEKQHILERVPDPFIQKYLKCLAVHICTLPITQVISVVVAAYVAIRYGKTWTAGLAYAGTVLFAFQWLPISPGSLTRGTYVVYLMIKERNRRNYWLAVIVSYWHYVGYLGFPLQMVKEFPTLSRFMAGGWATRVVKCIPVFGERGALLEHWIFDIFFNVPLVVRRWFEERRSEPWRMKQVALALGMALVFQRLLFRGITVLGAGEWMIALSVDLLVAVRAGVALATRERGRGWLFYCGLLYTSPIWIEVMSRVLVGLVKFFALYNIW